jgi:hypothetical protein
MRKIVIPLLAVLGIQAWLLVLNAFWGSNSHLTLLAIAMAVSVVSPVNRLIWRFLRRLRHPSPTARAATAFVVSVIAACGLGRYAIASGRDLFPTMHDEFQFLLQARMLASGRLWMPGHPLLDFFDTFYVLIQPRYAAQSFPGAAMFFVPALWLHVAPWKWAVGLSALCVGMFYLVVTELADGLAGVLAALLLGLLSMLHYVSTMVLAQTPMLLLGLAAVWVYLHWRRCRKPAWAVCVGFICGLMAITRPADAVIFGLPIGVGVLFDLSCQKPRGSYPSALVQMALMLGGAGPCMGVQLMFDRGVTGHWLTTPFGLYNQRDQPRLVYGLRAPDRAPPPRTRVIEKRQYYHSLQPLLAAHRPDQFWKTFIHTRLPVTIGDDLPQPMLVVLLPVGLLAWGRRRAWVLGATLPLFFLIYMFYPLFPAHYTIIAAPAVILSVVLAARAISLAWPAARAGAWSAVTIFVVGLCVTKPVDCYQMTAATAFHATVLKAADEQTALVAAEGRPAVVLFRRDPHLLLDYEPVYNLDAAWPDDELVIRAHDRRGDNWRIFQYYALHGPDRAFYLFDESRPNGVTFLGMASELARNNVGH